MTNHRKNRRFSFAALLIERIIIITLSLSIWLLPARAHALQPLADFLRQAAQRNFDNREARATAVQRVHEASQAWARLLPSLTFQGDYIRNQYLGEAFVPDGPPGSHGVLPTRKIVITPVDQWDASFVAALSLIDVAEWDNVGAAANAREAQQAREAATALEVQKTVARTYYQLIGASAVARAARRTLAAAEDNARFIETRTGAGLASELDLKRALAEVERDRQAIEDADYSTVTLRRSLETLTGLTSEGDPAQDAPALPADELREEPPLAEWTTSVEKLPSVQAAAHDERAADRTADGALAALYPALSAQFTERATDAVGFGQSPYYAVEALATWKFDFNSVESARAQRAAAEASAVRHDRARATAADTLFNDWHSVRTQIAKARAARTSLESSRLALSVAHEKYGSGKATLLDVVQAERDAFSAEVTDIQAEADLASARAALQLSAGRSLVSQ
jgi:outer membrane protein TolC